MGGAVVAVLVLVLLVVWAVILVVMIRAAKAQRERTTRKDFGGRYTSFGFLFGLLRSEPETKPTVKTTEQPSNGADNRACAGND